MTAGDGVPRRENYPSVKKRRLGRVEGETFYFAHIKG